MKKFLFFTIVSFTFTPIAFTQPQINLLWEKTANVRSMEFSPNGQFLVTGGSTNICYPFTCGQIKIWSVQDSTLLRTITGNNIGHTNDISFFSDGQTFITAHGSIYCAPKGGCSVDKAGQFKWNFNTGDSIEQDLNQNGTIESVDISPDQTMIAAAVSYNNVGEIRIYDSQYNLLRTLPGHAEGTTSLKFSPDNLTLVSGGHDGNVKIWNVQQGTLLRTMHHGDYLNGGWDLDIDISHNGQVIGSAGQGYMPTVKMWNFSDGQLLHTFLVDSSDGYNKISFSPNGLYLAAGSIVYGLNGIGYYGLLSFLRVADGGLAEQYVDYTGSPTSGGVWSLAFSPTGNNYFAYSISNKLRIATTNINLVTLTSIGVTGKQPMGYQSFSNYPNPFNPATKINFEVPQNADPALNYKLTIYDAIGKEVSVLHNNKLSPGPHEFVFNGSNFSSGTYFYQITILKGSSAVEYSKVMKMILLK